MKFYLRYANPALALTILALCVWAASTQDGSSPNLAGIVSGGFGSYFFAKGLFCSAALFLSGISLLRRWESGENTPLYRWKDVAFVVVLASAIVGGLYAYGAFSGFPHDKSTQTATSIANPKELEITGLTAIPQSQFLSITGKVKNASAAAWESIEIEAEVFHGATFTGRLQCRIAKLKSGESRYFVLQSDGLRTDRLLDSLRFNVDVTATPQTDSVGD